MSLASLWLTGALFVAGGTPSAYPGALPEQFAAYRWWYSLTREPYPVPPDLAIMCAHPPVHLTADQLREHGPHSMRYIRIFVNEAARSAFGQRASKPFPPGSVIVKEKLLSPLAVTHSGIGVMVKRQAGYDPAAGDWQFLYVPEGSVTANATANTCTDCHRAKRTEDFVFGSYAK
jgi:hypothetical protein